VGGDEGEGGPRGSLFMTTPTLTLPRQGGGNYLGNFKYFCLDFIDILHFYEHSMRRITINRGRCMGCMTCLNICSFVHEGEFNPKKAHMTIYMDPFTGDVEGEVKESCDQCGGKAECVRWCPVGALKYSSQ
jgi:ferredoxin